MKQPILIADSGSTKTDWCLLHEHGQHTFQTAGINPLLQEQKDIANMMLAEMDKMEGLPGPELVCYYGAGAGNNSAAKKLQAILQNHFANAAISIEGDMLAAARALCGSSAGIACILGTGSNSCYYDGEGIAEQQVSLGYIAGDEGSGNYMGKRVLQYYAYHTFDAELIGAFELLFGKDLPAFITKLYGAAYPNRLLASLVTLLAQNRGHYMVENIIEDCLSDFFQHHLLKYRQSWSHPIHFCGSVAAQFSDVIVSLCHQYELEPGIILKSPMEGLINYHRRQLE